VLNAERAQIEQFIAAIFPYADEGTFISLRAFDQFDGGQKALFVTGVKIGNDIPKLVTQAAFAAERAANYERPAVFAPPVATFNNKQTARSIDIANGVAISVEVDSGDTKAARARLEGLLGPVTIAMTSGGEWIDPETGEVHAKMHLHWRLSEPTRTPEDHGRLQYARALAARLIGGDPTAAPSAHPLRWPGSWNTKAKPRLASICAGNQAAEVHLDWALEKLEEAAEVSGIGADNGPRVSGTPTANMANVVSALAHIPNKDCHWCEWVRIGMALYRASGGSSDGLDAWCEWSAKSPKHEDQACVDRWAHFGTSPPTKIGAGTIFFMARAEGWQRPSSPAREDVEPPAEDEEAYMRSLEQYAETMTEQHEGDPAQAIDGAVRRFNGRYMVVNEAGKAMVFHPKVDPVLHRRFFDRISFQDLKNLYMNDWIEVGKDGDNKVIRKTSANIWLSHPKRRQFIHGVTFDPTAKQSEPGVLNLWEGYAVKPAKGDWRLMKSHILSIICRGNHEHYEYLLSWIARMLQRPAEQGEVAVVMKGGEGTGKGTLAKALMKITGHHGLAISNGKHLVGNFNAHLRDVVFLFADEAFFAGDRSHVGALKSLITESYLTIEAKYSNAQQTPNFLHVMMASNEEWVVPASLDARRFLVLEVDSAAQGAHDYFVLLNNEIDNGGLAAMLHDLLERDLTNFNVRAVPSTEGLQKQRKLSLGTTEAWWIDCLERGYVFRSKLGLEATFSVWMPIVSTEVLFASYIEYAKSRAERRILTRETLGKFLTSMGLAPTRCARGKGIVGEHMSDADGFNGPIRKAAPVLHVARAPAYAVLTLDEARAAFSSATGLEMDWADDRVDDDE
jgi:hypothetical protein